MTSVRTYAGSLYFHDDGSCNGYYRSRIGMDMFHVHVAALSVARNANKHAGRKVKRVIVAKQHFMVVDV